MNRINQEIVCAVLAALAAPAHAENAPGFDRAGWLADLHEVRDAMSAGYANLEWAVAVRGMDLKATYAEAQREIEAASDDAAARAALTKFVGGFADGHLEIRWPSAAVPAGATPAPPSTAPAPLCEQLGYTDFGDAGAIATHLEGFRPVGRDPHSHFPAGVVIVAGRRMGVLRIPIFMPQGMPDLCPAVLEAAQMPASSSCDAVCEERLGRIADEHFIKEFEAQLRAVIAANPDLVLVDIAGNGGGNDSAIAMTRMLSGRELQAPRMGFVRTARWTKELGEREAEIDAGLTHAAGAERALLSGLKDKLVAARREAATPCDRSPLWESRRISCSAIVATPLYAAGLIPLDLPQEWHARPWAETVSATVRYTYTAQLWRGPLIVLIDGGSASSSELFAAMLQDNRAALVIGAPSYGAGCGHAVEDEPVRLGHSGGELAMPDCVRLRADGRDEVSGIDPDLLIGFHRRDTPFQRASRLQAALPAAVARALQP